MSVRHVLGFLTVIPSGKGDVKEAAKYAWLFPLVGAFVGLLAGYVGYFASYILSYNLSAALELFALLILTGFHHFDGLLDVGDAVMFRGSKEDRLKIMHDANTGAGGFALGFFVLLITYVSLTDVQNMFTAAIVAEASAKFSMVLLMYFGRASHEGMGSIFVDVIRKNHRLVLLASLFYLPIVLPLSLGKGMRVLLTVILFSIFTVYFSDRSFGGISGDIIGAANEIARMLVLLVLI